ncbi:tetratricopeptide repeat protein [Chitinophaga qingshengii]|uniref:Tetratricopeptide repeat protein n=1 Tax=Chitinophaga qingshengii TaxID=1569794 RepID=A0ABR7TRK8_9BACT|nr:tetratricopeptide repeat protein [Chitinophaga qingshengii]MBC9932039.1 tetratricopeptide repeat protein [Chitinophaga qingshengii]
MLQRSVGKRCVVFFFSLLFIYTELSAQRSGLVSSDVLYKMALEARNAKDYTKAIKFCNKALSQSPDYTDIRILLGKLYQETGQPVAAAFEWNVALKKDPGNTDVLHSLVNLYYSQGNKAEAICYVDMLLDKDPLNKDLLLKKYGLVEESGDLAAQSKVMAVLRAHYISDPVVAGLLKDYQMQAARRGRKSGDLNGSEKMYEQVLLKDKNNVEALQGIASTLEGQGRSREALAYYNQLLTIQPDSATWRLKRSSIQLANGNYAAALEDAKRLYQQHPGQSLYKQHLADVYTALARQPDAPATYMEQLLLLQPGNKAIYQQLINQAYQRSDYSSANDWCNKALLVFPGDVDVLRKQIGIQEKMQDYSTAATTAQKLLQLHPGATHEQIYTDLQLSRANRLVAQQPGEAATILQTALKQVPGKRELLLLLSNVQTALGKPQEALPLLEQLLAKQPADTALLFKKSGLLETMQRYPEAAAVSQQLMTAYPTEPRYRQAYLDQAMAGARKDIAQRQYTAAEPALLKILQLMPANKEAWVYLINLKNEQQQTAQALDYTTRALGHISNDSLLLQKKSALLQQAGRYTEASAIAADLHQRYPADTALRNMYLDQLLAQGKQLRERQQWDSAWQLYQTAYALAPADTTVLTQLTATATARKQYDTVLVYADKGLAVKADQPELLSQKANALEQLHRYADAALVAGQLRKLQPGEKKWQQYSDHLNGYTYKNQIGIIYLQSVYSRDYEPASITSLQYLHRFQRGTVTGRVNYANREAGDGVQLEAETYYTHNPKYYSYGLFGWSNSNVFPNIRAGYSLFRNFSKGWEGELGARYVKSDSINTYSAVASVGKYFGNYWVNLRGFLTSDEHQWYQAYTLTNRFYLNDRQDFIALIGNIGASPDDRSRNFQFGKVAGFTSTSLTAGFQKNIRGRATIGAYGSWIRQQIPQQSYLHQFDTYLLFLWNFK